MSILLSTLNPSTPRCPTAKVNAGISLASILSRMCNDQHDGKNSVRPAAAIRPLDCGLRSAHCGLLSGVIAHTDYGGTQIICPKRLVGHLVFRQSVFRHNLCGIHCSFFDVDVVTRDFDRTLPFPPISNGTIFSNGTVKNPDKINLLHYATMHYKLYRLA